MTRRLLVSDQKGRNRVVELGLFVSSWPGIVISVKRDCKSRIELECMSRLTVCCKALFEEAEPTEEEQKLDPEGMLEPVTGLPHTKGEASNPAPRLPFMHQLICKSHEVES